jgi:DNA-binding winged helix-turn-helix (wHTH) protein
MKLLEVLLDHPGEIVTREELRSRVCPNESFGDFDQAVNHCNREAPERVRGLG